MVGMGLVGGVHTKVYIQKQHLLSPGGVLTFLQSSEVSEDSDRVAMPVVEKRLRPCHETKLTINR